MTLQARLKEKNIKASYASCWYSHCLLSECNHTACGLQEVLKQLFERSKWDKVQYLNFSVT